MAYTDATCVRAERLLESGLRVLVRYSGADETALEVQHLVQNGQQLQGVARSHLAVLNAGRTLQQTLAENSPIDVSVPPPTAPTPPTTAEIARAQWLRRYEQLARLKQARVLTTQLATLEAEVAAGYLSEYLPFAADVNL